MTVLNQGYVMEEMEKELGERMKKKQELTEI